jgi:hypothetical protein
MKTRTDYTAEFPNEITSTALGVLQLKLSSLMAGDEEIAKFCHYEAEASAGVLTAHFIQIMPSRQGR